MSETESGVTLLEFMIGIGLLSLITLAATHFLSRVNQSDAELSAKIKTQSELSNLTRILSNDLKFREMGLPTDLCTSPVCTQFSIDRLAPAGGSYKVTYTSSCKKFPTNSIYSTLHFDKVSSQCIKVLNCPAGTYPSLAIDVPSPPVGGQLPNYPAATPTHGQGRGAYSLIGAAVCASKTLKQAGPVPQPTSVSKDRIIVEGAFLGSNHVIRVERKETVFSSNNMAKIQMLPN